MHKKPVANSWFSFPFPYKMCIPSQVRCHRPPIWPTALPLNIIFILIVLLILSLVNLTRTSSYVQCTKFHIHIPSLRSFIQSIRPSPRLGMKFHNNLVFYGARFLAPWPVPRLEDHPLSFIRCYSFKVCAATLHSWRASLHPQPEDEPCGGDRDPLDIDSTDKIFCLFNILLLSVVLIVTQPTHFDPS
jgi:hypothetical protein